MSKPLIALALIAPLLVGASRDRREVPEATPDGKPQSCIQIHQISSTRVHGDQVIDFVMRGGKVYRNTLPYACPNLGFEERFSYTTSLSVLCSTDIITVLYTTPLSAGPSCGLGEFQPVKLTPKVKPQPAS